MSEERSILVYDQYRKAEEKFDYFVIGVAAALFAYVGQHLQAERLGANSYTIQVASMLFLIASVAAGFQRIQKGVTAIRTSHLMLEDQTMIARFRAATTASATTITRNELTGEVLDHAKMAREIERLQESVRMHKRVLDMFSNRLSTFYKIRNITLYIGFLGLLVAKIIGPYIDTSQ